MKQEEIYLKTSEYIAKFKNGEKKYHESVLFNQVIQMLVRDVDPIDVIDQLITVAENTQRAFEQYIHRDTRPININGEKYTVDYEKK